MEQQPPQPICKMICSKAYYLNDVVNVKPIEEDNTEEPPPSTEAI